MKSTVRSKTKDLVAKEDDSVVKDNQSGEENSDNKRNFENEVDEMNSSSKVSFPEEFYDERNPTFITLGRLLKIARENKNMSLVMIGQTTKISLSNLRAIEAGNSENLPHLAYLKGFIKDLSKIVGLDVDKVLSLLFQITNGETGQDSKKLQDKMVKKKEKKKKKKFIFENNSFFSKIQLKALALAPIVILLIIFSVKKINSKLNVPSNKNEETIVAQVLTSYTPLRKSEVEISAKLQNKKLPDSTKVVERSNTTESMNTTIAPKLVEAVQEQKKLATKSLEREKKEILDKKVVKEETDEKKYKFYDINLPLYTTEKITKENISKYIPSEFSKIIVNQGLSNIFIKTLPEKSTWISYKVDDGKVRGFNLHGGQNFFLKGKKIRLVFGNIHVVKVFLNNELLKFSSKTKVKSLVFPDEYAKQLKLPLFIYRNGVAVPSDEYMRKKSL